MYQILIFLTFIYSQLNVSFAVQSSAECGDSQPERGFALQRATYISKVIENFIDCVNECINDSPCMSINFWWYTKKCDLNSKIKEHSCLSCFVAEPYSTYMGMEKTSGNRGK